MIYDKSACPRVGKQLVLGLLPLQSRVVIVCSDHRGATRPLAQIDGSLGKCPSPFTLHASAIASLYQEANTGLHRAYPRDVPWATDGRSASGSPRGWANQQSPAGWLPALWHLWREPRRHGSERSRRGQEVLDLHDGAHPQSGGLRQRQRHSLRVADGCRGHGVQAELSQPRRPGQLLMRELEARTAGPQAAKEEAESLQ